MRAMEVSGGGDGKVLKILFPVPEIQKIRKEERMRLHQRGQETESREAVKPEARIKRMSDRKGGGGVRREEQQGGERKEGSKKEKVGKGEEKERRGKEVRGGRKGETFDRERQEAGRQRPGSPGRCLAACSGLGGRGAPRQSEGQVSIVPYKEGVGPPFQPFFLPGRGRGISGFVNTGVLGALKKNKDPPSFLYWG